MSNFVRPENIHKIVDAICFDSDMEKLNDVISYLKVEGLTAYVESLERTRDYLNDCHWMGGI